jgi:hypothetical protein
MIALIIAVVLAIGTGGTIVVADSAKPGDALFGIDQGVEKIRLSISSDDNKEELKIKFAQERVDELEELVDEAESDDSDTPAMINETTVTEIEADVFTNETVIKIEADDETVVFTTSTKTRIAIVAAINTKYPTLSKTFIEGILDLETKNRASTEENKNDGKKLSDDESEDVRVGLEAALSILTSLRENSDSDDPRIKGLTTAINAIMAKLPSGTEIEIEDDRVKIKIEDEDDEDDDDNDSEDEEENETKVEIKSESGDIKLEIKNGNLEIKSEGDSQTSPSKGLEEVEAKVYSDTTVIQVEYNDQKTTFNISGKTKEDVVAAVIAKFPSLTSAQINAVLEFEVEDDDENEDEDDQSDDDEDNSGSDEDEEDEDDNSGSGSDND